jgi:hypothetical protein
VDKADVKANTTPNKNLDPPNQGLSSYDDVIKITGKMSELPYA